MSLDPAGRSTIVALSTPPGIGAIAVLRLSGPESRALVEPLLDRPIRWNRARVFYRRLLDHSPATSPAIIDDVLVTWFEKPGSYTGEEMVEISCHGNPTIVKQITRLLLIAGARMARPGEFTERAFLNDKLPLTQAEAVLDLITAPTERALASARAMKEGRLGSTLEGIRQEMVDLLSHLEASLDFAEEGIEPRVGIEFYQRIELQQALVRDLLRTAPLSRILREGALVVIVGQPNVGKSSLLNALLREDRAIVAATPGTTRDIIEAECSIRGIPVRLIDTAGQREALDPIEAEGIRRARAKQEEAHLILRVIEAHLPFHEAKAPEGNTPIPYIVVANKSDLGVHPSLPAEAVHVSASTNDGLTELEAQIETKLLGDPAAQPASTSGVAVNARQSSALQRIDAALQRALDNGKQHTGLEIISIDLRDALTEMADLIGQTTNEDILTRLFQNFCIGK